MSEWRDKATGQEPKRANWKLVVNQFFRNDISRNGRVVTHTNHDSINSPQNRNRYSNIQPAELEKSVNNILEQRAALANNQAGFGANRGDEASIVPDGKVFEF